MHFRQLFAILELLEFGKAKACTHLSYGMVNLPEGRMKSREGTVVDADELMQEMEDLAREEIRKRHELSSEELDRRAHAISIAALKFYLLKQDVTKDMTYDPKESISFEGETGPYVLYTYARISSILRKHGKEPVRSSFEGFGEDEHIIVSLLERFSKIQQEASSQHKPSTLCHYLLELCQAFNEYYHKVPVLKAEGTLRDSRVFLAAAARKAIRDGLALLDIGTIEEM
jgi:arginyl-tRNA synthetase